MNNCPLQLAAVIAPHVFSEDKDIIVYCITLIHMSAARIDDSVARANRLDVFLAT
jgi:hypothetical protein